MNLKTPVITLVITMLVSLSGYTADTSAPQTDSTLTDEEIQALIWVREEEKLARDTYITLYERWNARIFSNISRSEQKHMDAMLTILNTYGIQDPVTDDTVGVFTDETLDELYDKLINDGDGSLSDALHVGAFIEELDIKDIREALDGVTQADIIAVYENLLTGSYKHLNAFVGQIEGLGITYQPQVLSQTEVDAILGRSDMNAQMADGSWMVTGHDGEGMVIDVTADGVFLIYWMTYDSQGNQVWLLGLTDQSSEAVVELTMYQYSGPAFGPGFNSQDLVSELWGDVTINFLDCGTADVHYQSVSGFGSGDLKIQRIYYAAGSLCQPE